MSVTHWNQFDERDEAMNDCSVWEAMCPDAVDGMLSPAEQAAFDRHIAGCVRCSEELDSVQRGAAWLQMLKGHEPQPPADLMTRILAQTSGSSEAYQPKPVFVPEPVSEIWTRPRQPTSVLGFWAAARARVADIFQIEGHRASFQPRFAMTAAMAFFSAALSLNLLGVRLSDVRHMDFHRGSLTRTVATATASATRSFQNNRVIYQLESRVSELGTDDLPATGNSDDSMPRRHHQDDDKQSQPKAPQGSSELQMPRELKQDSVAAATRKGV
ncbi:MAG: zf-HC2 domain-containing protein [Acidobacteriaceae bacterium]|nr:zf-HC2 domain-containing protein [Acidobacteriaceae bacterium]